MSGYEVIYLTGIPAVGKSTLTSHLLAKFPHLKVLEYGALLAEHVSASSASNVSQTTLKEKSAQIVTSQHVTEMDAKLLELVEKSRLDAPVIIDSHAVTIENFGFRVTPFSSEKIKKLRPTRIVFLNADAETVIARIKENSQGRPIPSLEEIRDHKSLQMAVAVSYCVICGVPLYVLENDGSNQAAFEKLSAWLNC